LLYATNIKNIFSVFIYFGAEGRLQLFCMPLVLVAAVGLANVMECGIAKTPSAKSPVE
jgi:hypothetical protein